MGQKQITCDDALEAVRAEDGVVADAAERLECSRMTIYRRAHEDDRIWEALHQERESLVNEMRQRAKEMARTAESERVRWDATMKILSVFDEDQDWADRKRTDVTSGGEPVSSIQLQVVETDADSFEQERREDE